MATGYTYFIENGDISTGAEFLKKCIRNFGCCIDQREDPLSSPLITEVKPSSYYKEQYENTVKKYDEFKSKTNDEIREMMRDQRDKVLSDTERYLSKQKLLRNKYLIVREDVENWVPPTPDHEGIKRFALEQIGMSIPTEDDINELEEKVKKLKNSSTEINEGDIGQYIIDTMRYFERDIEYYRQKMIEDEEQASKRTKFIQDFLSSLN